MDISPPGFHGSENISYFRHRECRRAVILIILLQVNKTFNINTMSLRDFKGVLTGDQVQELFEIAKANQFALPAENVIGTNSINEVMETAKTMNSPVIVQLSNGGAQFYADKTMNNDNLRRSEERRLGEEGRSTW